MASGANGGSPHILIRPARKMAVARTIGEPSVVAGSAVGALFRCVGRLKAERSSRGLDFEMEALRARWPNAHLAPKEEWEGRWAIPVPDDVTVLPSEPGVTLEMWDYGDTAEIVHLGPYDEEGPDVAALHEFIAEHGFEIAGPHEEEYLSPPGAADQRTIIRYAVRPARAHHGASKS